jgi:N-acyl-D-aspartate/D-glutamate deacylase
VQRYTRAPAELIGLFDRDLIAPGMKADINVIDYANLYLSPPHIVRDLPAGGRRLMQTAKGYVATIVSGQSVIEHDQATGALPGKMASTSLRNPSLTAPSRFVGPCSPVGHAIENSGRWKLPTTMFCAL